MDLDALRMEIDLIDDDIVKLLDRRYRCALRIGEYKKTHQLPVRNPKREAEVLSRLQSSRGIVPEIALKNIYQAIMAGAVELEKNS